MENNTVNNVPNKLDRKTIERNRRIHMKRLISELTSLVPPQHFKPSKELLSQQDQIDQVADYIKKLRERLEKLKNRKKLAISSCERNTDVRNSALTSSRFPVLKIREFGSNLEVVLVSGIRKNFAIHEVIKVLEEEGVEVVSVSISTMDQNVHHILHAQVKVSRFGVDTSMIYDRLQKLFN
ncbi:hypothetical protein ACH5RR_025593 [Cinchona calisaya]|uniref:BHLH domain-containing protein n=1 Tax=Cinchona calisaya TaxID=153742 RepID=A0ABD2Z206_9GENT